MKLNDYELMLSDCHVSNHDMIRKVECKLDDSIL